MSLDQFAHSSSGNFPLQLTCEHRAGSSATATLSRIKYIFFEREETQMMHLSNTNFRMLLSMRFEPFHHLVTWIPHHYHYFLFKHTKSLQKKRIELNSKKYDCSSWFSDLYQSFSTRQDQNSRIMPIPVMRRESFTFQGSFLKWLRIYR